jgi:hypothetical protein
MRFRVLRIGFVGCGDSPEITRHTRRCSIQSAHRLAGCLPTNTKGQIIISLGPSGRPARHRACLSPAPDLREQSSPDRGSE